MERFECTFNKNFCKEKIFGISNLFLSESLLYFNRKILTKNSLARERGLSTCDFGVKLKEIGDWLALVWLTYNLLLELLN